MRTRQVQSALGVLLRPKPLTQIVPTRWAHQQAEPPQIPQPIPLVPDVKTFLSVIGRGLSQYTSKFPTWEALFSLSSDQLKQLGIEPPRTRRYLLAWCNRFRLGQFGVGGDFKYVENGVAELKVQKTFPNPLKPVRTVVNIPPGRSVEEASAEERVRVKGYSVQGARVITGPYALPLKVEDGSGARVTVTEGMWEDKRGHKIDGGERRRAEVRFKKRIAERKARREQRQ